MMPGGDAQAQFQRAVDLQRRGQIAEADAVCRQLMAREPRHFGAYHMAGLIALQAGHLQDGVALLEQSLRLEPRQAGALANLGNAYLTLQRPDAALACLDQAIALQASHALSWFNRGNACRLLQRSEEALTSYQTALRLNPAHAGARNNLGLLLLELGRPEPALQEFDQAVAREPTSAAFHRNRAHALLRLGQHDAGIAALQRCIQLAPGDASAHAELGRTLAAAGRWDDALRALTQAWQLEPADELTLGELFHLKRSRCHWDNHESLEATLVARLAAAGRLHNPLTLLLLDRPALALSATRVWAKAALPPAAPSPPARTTPRLRIAYVSADFCEHPVSRQLIGVLENHDRRRVEIMGVSLRRPGEDAFSQRVRAAFDEFVAAENLDDAGLVALLRARQIDIAVDLMGLTLGMRPGVFAARIAPLQVNYLGFAGTVGARHLDYLIGDSTVLPEAADAHYAERLVRLPHSFMPMDDRRVDAPLPARHLAGLPESGAVLCAFTQAHKIDPRMFDVWMRLLQTTADSVLWLRSFDRFTCDNLRAAAAARGVAPERLRFAPYVARMEDHLARHRLADLFLDTAPLNAHSTLCDALWAGVPAITCAGQGLAARVGASALQAAGLAELVTGNLAEYERLATALLAEPARLLACRRRLADMRAVAPLFDTAGYTRSLERAYGAMQARALRGDAPAALMIS